MDIDHDSGVPVSPGATGAKLTDARNDMNDMEVESLASNDLVPHGPGRRNRFTSHRGRYHQVDPFATEKGNNLWRLPSSVQGQTNKSDYDKADRAYDVVCARLRKLWCEPEDIMPDLLKSTTPYSWVLLSHLMKLATVVNDLTQARNLMLEQYHKRTSSLPEMLQGEPAEIVQTTVSKVDHLCSRHLEGTILEHRRGLMLVDVANVWVPLVNSKEIAKAELRAKEKATVGMLLSRRTQAQMDKKQVKRVRKTVRRQLKNQNRTRADGLTKVKQTAEGDLDLDAMADHDPAPLKRGDMAAHNVLDADLSQALSQFGAGGDSTGGSQAYAGRGAGAEVVLPSERLQFGQMSTLHNVAQEKRMTSAMGTLDLSSQQPLPALDTNVNRTSEQPQMHNETDRPNSSRRQYSKSKVCKFWQRGKCAKGDQCTFKHQ